MINWLVWDRIRAISRSHKIYQGERLFQDQFNLDRLVGSSEFFDWGSQQSILDQSALFIHRLERYKDYDAMDQGGVMSLVWDLYADEASLVDPERKHTIIIKAKTKRIKTELEELFFNTLQWDRQCRPCARYLSKMGDCPWEIVLDNNRSGVVGLRHMNAYNFTRVETRHGDLVGFYYQDEVHPEPIFMHPWQVAHMRLTTFESVFSPYGKGVGEGSRKPYKQLRMMEDSALVYRITRGPEKRKFKIPVGNIPAKDIPQYLQMIARTFKRRRFYNPITGSFDERYSPLIQEDDFILPVRPDGTGPDIETLPGGQNLDQIADIEYFKKNMVSPTKIPFSRVGIGEKAGEANKQSLSQESSEFSKAVQWIQREMASCLTKVAIVHLLLRGFSVEDCKSFEITMTATSAIEELYRIETWQTRVDIMSGLKELGWFPKEWIVTHFTDMSPDEIEELKEMQMLSGENAPQSGEGGGGGGGGGGIPGMDLDGGGGDLDAAAGGDTSGMDAGGMGGGMDDGGGDGGDTSGDDLFSDLDESTIKAKKDKLKVIRELMLKKRLLVEWAERMGKDTKSDVWCNPFDFYVNNYEFDGLKGAKPSQQETVIAEETIVDEYDGGNQDDYIVYYGTDKSERDTALNEARNILVGTAVAESDSDETEITDDDLPS